MARTTLNIDDPVLRRVKAMGKREGKSLGTLVSTLLARALDDNARLKQNKRTPLLWKPKSMGHARVNLLDKDAVQRILDGNKK